MNENPPSIWKRRLPNLTWFALLLGATFVIIFGLAFAFSRGDHSPELVPFALVVSAIMVVLVAGALLVIPWLSNWRNLRRFLFAIVCLITLVALAYAEENWRGKHAWQTHRRQWEAKGELFTIAALVPPPVPDDKNFALTPLLKPALDLTQTVSGVVWRDTNGVARLQKISAELTGGNSTNDHLAIGVLEPGTYADLPACAAVYRGNTNYPQAPASATPAELVLAALDKFAPEIRELREAAANRPYSRFPIQYDYQPCWGILLPHLARVKGLTILMQVRATAELEAGRPADALADLKVGFRLSDSIRDEPILIDDLVRLATMGINLQAVREGLVRHAWTEAQLAELENYLGSIDLLSEYKHAMRGERAFEVSGLNFLRRQGFRNNPMDYIGNEDGGSASTPPLNFIPGGWFYQNMVGISRMFQDFTLPTVDEKAHRVFPELSQQGEAALNNSHTGPYNIFVKLLLPAMEKAVRKPARMQTYLDSAHVACALERYRLANGKLPDTLEAIVPSLLARIPNDVIDGKPLRYRLKPDGGYILYSVGWNQTDDGGQLSWSKEQKRETSPDITQGDWVWQMAARLP